MAEPTQKGGITGKPAPAGRATVTQTAAAPGNKDHRAQLVSPDAIRLRAYQKWENAGKPSGDDFRFWLEAEQELKKSQ